jgi:hypothetical protein
MGVLEQKNQEKKNALTSLSITGMKKWQSVARCSEKRSNTNASLNSYRNAQKTHWAVSQ